MKHKQIAPAVEINTANKKIPIAFSNNKFSEVSESKEVSWKDLVTELSSINPGHKDGKGWLPAAIGVGPRSGDRVKSVSLLVLDVEAKTEISKGHDNKPLLDEFGDAIKKVIGPEPPTFDVMRNDLDLFGWQSIVHTSYGHRDEHQRYRIVLAISRPVLKTTSGSHEIKTLAMQVALQLGINDCVDTSCMEPARLYYLPRAPKARVELFRFAEIHGKPIDVEEVLSRAKTVEVATKTAIKQKSSLDFGENIIEAFNRAHPIGHLLEDHGYDNKGLTRWLAPCSASGMAGVHLLPDAGLGKEMIYSFHSNDPLADGHAHDAFDVHKILNHDGDFKAALTEASKVLGLERCQNFDALKFNDPHLLPNASPTKIKLMTAAEIIALPPLQWLVKDVLPTSGLATIFGQSGAGKTFLALDVGVSVADGTPWFGRRVVQRPVVYVALEGEFGLSKRLHALRKERGDKAGSNMHFVVSSFSLLNHEHVAELVAEIRAAKLEQPVIIIDTLSRAMPGGDENSGVDMGIAIEAAKSIQRAVDGLVILVHHAGKDPTRGMRGHSSLFAGADAVIMVRRENGARAWSIAKAKDSEDSSSYSFSLDTIEVGIDPDDGTSVTSCVVRESDQKLPPPKRNPEFDVLIDLIKENGVIREGYCAVAIEIWREVFYNAYPVRNSDARRKGFNRARQSLEKQGLILIQDGFIVPSDLEIQIRLMQHLSDRDGVTGA